MSKKKEQVRFLKKKFAAVIKAFEKEKDKKKRKEAFEFLCGRIAEFGQYESIAAGITAAEQTDGAAKATPAITGVQPSPALVEELRASQHNLQN
ncbi:hypothetical protein ACFQZI_06755 [Mucilaginibacter lutimaris]|uniref:Uncharacterized protein n=1 Tax=Mucilaginibacter lutimaris TaxID=931629 RepID=A0ABW2ZEC8_9SPHI